MNAESKNEEKKFYKLYSICLICYCVAIEFIVLILIEKSILLKSFMFSGHIIVLSSIFLLLNYVRIKVKTKINILEKS